MISSAADADDGLVNPIEAEFNKWIEGDDHQNNSRLTQIQYFQYRYWAEHLEAKAKNQKESNYKQQAKKFEWTNRLLYRRSISTRTENFDTRQVI